MMNLIRRALLWALLIGCVSASEEINVTAESGLNVTLPCRAPNKNIVVVEWSRADLESEYVHFYRDGQLNPDYQHPSFKNRVDLQDRQMKDGDVSVILKDVTINDTGTYECRVIHRGTNRWKRALLKTAPISIIYLRVVAPPDIPQVKVRPGQDVTLQCQGPRGVNITLLEWIRPELKPDYVFFYRNRRPYENYHHERFKGRVELRDPSVKHGDVSLILRNVSAGDTGTYKCRIITSNSSSGVRVQSEFHQSINLTVTDSDDHAKEIGEKDGEDKNGRDKERGGERIPPSVIVIPLAVVGFIIVVIAVVIYKKTKKSSKKSGPYQHPPETADVKPVKSVYT